MAVGELIQIVGWISFIFSGYGVGEGRIEMDLSKLVNMVCE